jgi:hypothetical protein
MIDYIFLNTLLTVMADPANLIKYGGIFLLLVIIYLETGFFLGLILPKCTWRRYLDWNTYSPWLLSGSSLPTIVKIQYMVFAGICNNGVNTCN